MYTLFTDTDCDFTPANAREYGCRLISMPYSVEASTVYPYADGTDMDLHAFYDTLRNGVIPTTSALSRDEYFQIFEREFAAGHDIFYVHFSAAMTVTFDVMNEVVDQLKEKYPERKFLSVDTKGITLISFLIARTIFDMIKDGKTPEDIVEWAKTEIDHFGQWFFADDLKFFRRSGRVGGLAATMGGLIGLRPIIYMSSAGKMESIGTVKGRQNAMERLISIVEEKGDNIKDFRFVVGHTDAPWLAYQLGDMLKAKFGDDLDIEYVVTNPTAGSHCGPNGVGVAFHCKSRD